MYAEMEASKKPQSPREGTETDETLEVLAQLVRLVSPPFTSGGYGNSTIVAIIANRVMVRPLIHLERVRKQSHTGVY